MRRWTIILIAIIVILLIFIVIFADYTSVSEPSNYSQIEIQMRKLWY